MIEVCRSEVLVNGGRGVRFEVSVAAPVGYLRIANKQKPASNDGLAGLRLQ